MKHLILAAAAAAALISAPALAALPVGATAPEFKATAFQAGKPFQFELAKALKKGPVVLYFFPAAHTRAATSRRTCSPTRSTSSSRRARP